MGHPVGSRRPRRLLLLVLAAGVVAAAMAWPRVRPSARSGRPVCTVEVTLPPAPADASPVDPQVARLAARVLAGDPIVIERVVVSGRDHDVHDVRGRYELRGDTSWDHGTAIALGPGF